MKVPASKNLCHFCGHEVGASDTCYSREQRDWEHSETHGAAQRRERDRDGHAESCQGRGRQHAIGPAAPSPSPRPDDENDKDLGRYRANEPSGAKCSMLPKFELVPMRTYLSANR